jgi:hypothetical protein
VRKPRKNLFWKDKKMLNQALDILSSLGILSAIQFTAVAVAAIYIYRYFTDRS